MELITLRNDCLTMDISPMGAEVQRIVDGAGIDRLWDGDPAYWKGRSPVLFPIAGALKGDTYTLDGRAYTLGKHGFARGSLFAVEEQGRAHATFLLAQTDPPVAGFPFPFAFRVRYALDGCALRVQYSTQNLGDAPFYFSTGTHEAYACPEGIEAYEVVFEQAEPLVHSLLDGSYLTGETMPIPTAVPGVLPLATDLFWNDSLVLAGLASRSATIRSRLHSRQIRIDYPDYPYLLIWTTPGAGYICFEPWGNLPDAMDSDQNIAHKPGMIRLAPGEAHSIAHTITFS